MTNIKTVSLAPIVLFVYNRLEHTIKTVESLAKNPLAKQSLLYIFSDGAKDKCGEDKVNEVRDYVNNLGNKNFFKKVKVFESQTNQGLAESIISGVSKVITENGKVIVMEDDLLSAPDFLDFMNQSLNFYQKNETVGSISGYSPLVTLPKEYTKDIWMAPRSSSLGWATWRERWNDVNWNVDDFDTFKTDKKAIRQFNSCGSDRYDRLRRQIQEGANSWSILFGYWQFRAGLNTVFPSKTRIQHIGWDGSGVHQKYEGVLDTQVSNVATPFCLSSVSVDEKIMKMLKAVYSGTRLSQLARYLRNNGFAWLEKLGRFLVKGLVK